MSAPPDAEAHIADIRFLLDEMARECGWTLRDIFNQRSYEDQKFLLARYDALLLVQQGLQRENEELKEQLARVDVKSDVPSAGSTAYIATSDGRTKLNYTVLPTPATKNYKGIACPLCDYTTGIALWSSYGEQSARAALRLHLCRKEHGMSGETASALANLADVVPLDDNLKRIVTPLTHDLQDDREKRTETER